MFYSWLSTITTGCSGP